jgi:nickel-dependent lactate racemase
MKDVSNVPSLVSPCSRWLKRPSEFILDTQKILVADNDYTRWTSTAEVLKYLELKGKEVCTVIATKQN